MTNAPLAGITMLEWGGGIAARYCGRLFAAHGARVLRTGGGEDRAGYGGAASAAFAAWLDHGKTRVPADLADCDSIDVAIIGPAPAEVAAAADALDARGSRALRVSLTWFDPRGPYRDWQGTDALIQAMSGVAYAIGPAEGPPLLPRGHAPQIVGGATASIAALAGVLGRARGWAGKSIALDILSANLCFAEAQAAAAALSGEPVARRGINQFTTYPGGVYPTRDGWIGVTALTPAQWAALCDLAELPELGREPRYRVMPNRLADRAAFEPRLRAAFARRPAAFWVEEGQRRRIPVAPMPDLAALPRTPHWQERGSFGPVPGMPEATAPTLPFRFADLGKEAPARVLPASAPDLPLRGVRVLDLSMGWAGPLAARHFADLGADVVKVESCGYFDWWRGWDGDMSTDPPPYETRPAFLMVNRNKRGVTLDLKTGEGRALLRRLAARADVLIENHAPGVLDKLGVGAALLARESPGLVALAMGAFGSRGPWRGFRAYGSTVEQASGLPFVNGRADDPPTMQHVAYGDPVSGLYGAAACLVALYPAQTMRRSTWIDLGQVECLFQLCADAVIAQSLRPDPLPREGTGSILCTCVPAAQPDEWLAVSVETEPQARALAALTCGDLNAWAAGRSAAEAASRLQKAGVPAAPVRPAHDLLNDPQLRAAGFWRRAERRFIGTHVVPLAPYRLDGNPPPLASAAPALGEHNVQVLGGELGLDGAALARLEAAGVIGTRPAARTE